MGQLITFVLIVLICIIIPLFYAKDDKRNMATYEDKMYEATVKGDVGVANLYSKMIVKKKSR